MCKAAATTKKSSLKDHNLSAPHNLARKSKENFDAEKAGLSNPPRKVVQCISPASVTAKSVQQMNKKDRAIATKLHEIVYYIALHELSFTRFEQLIKLEKVHKFTFTGAYENESACQNFIINIAEYFFQEDVKKKIEVVYFITYLRDGSTDKSITEQEVIYVIYVDPDTYLPVMNFFEIAAPENSQDATGLKKLFILAFSRHGLDSALKKTFFMSSDGAIRLLQKDYPWLAFVWGFSHGFELSLKDALLEFLKTLDNLFTHLFYIYSNSSKKIGS